MILSTIALTFSILGMWTSYDNPAMEGWFYLNVGLFLFNMFMLGVNL